MRIQKQVLDWTMHLFVTIGKERFLKLEKEVIDWKVNFMINNLKNSE